jgi:imidazolonepropionase-like amidohydrolase
MPGLFNLHGHVAMVEGWESKPENYNRSRLQRDANVYLYYGVTNMLSLGMDRQPMVAFKADQRAGKAGGARLYSAGLGFAALNGFVPEGNKDINRPTTPTEARILVQQEVKKGDDVIKIWVDDGYGRIPKLSPELYGVIIDEAHKYNRKVCAHMRTLDDAKELIRRGVDMLAHSVRDKEVDAEFLKLAKEKGIILDPDLVGHNADIAYAEGAQFLNDPGLPGLFPPDVLTTLATKEFQRKIANGWGRGNGSGIDPAIGDYDQEIATSRLLARTRKEYGVAFENLSKIAAAGVPIVVGTDSGRTGHFQGLWEHREMELLVKAGLTPMQAIQAGTINGARFLGVDRKLGSIEPGKVADFIVLDADPLADISNTRKIDSVWMKGKQVNREALKSYPTGI